MQFAEKDFDRLALNINIPWESLRNKKVFVTGGTGFFGKWLILSMAWANKRFRLHLEMTVLSRDPANFKKQNLQLGAVDGLRFIKGDIRDFKFPSSNFDYIIHAASADSADLLIEDKLEVFDIINAGTRRVLDFALQTGIKRFLLVSSGAVYGVQPHDMEYICENYFGTQDSLEPGSAYGIGKRSAELLSALYNSKYGIKATVARCFVFVGPYLNLNIHYAVGNFIRDCLAGQTIKVNGDGTPVRSYMYAADLAFWLWAILLSGRPGDAYNVGSDRCINIFQLADLVRNITQVDLKIEVVNTKLPESINRYIPDISKARAELGLDVWTQLEDAIKKTFEFYNSVRLYEKELTGHGKIQ